MARGIRVAAALGLTAGLWAAAAWGAEPEDDDLVCAPTLYETMAAIQAVPGLAMAPSEGQGVVSMRHDATGTLYTFTLPGAPGHPAVLKRKAVPVADGAALRLSACGYGDDPAGLEALKRGFGGEARGAAHGGA